VSKSHITYGTVPLEVFRAVALEILLATPASVLAKSLATCDGMFVLGDPRN
jgi:hypothetical protein